MAEHRHEPGAEPDPEMTRELAAWWHGKLCPRCGSPGPVSFGAELVCGRCGLVWHADAPERFR
jgi:hypothetical protein